MVDLKDIKKVAVGSTNPVKVQAVKDVLEYYLDHDFEIVGLAAPSGVSDMPLSREETKSGARNRTKRCSEQGGYDMVFGLEGGVEFDEGGDCYLFGCVSIVDRLGWSHTSLGLQYKLPLEISRRLAGGEELGPILDDMLKQKDTKKKGGTIGYLTHGRILRKDGFAQIVTYGFIPWLNKDLYID